MSIARLCVTVTGRTMADLRARRDQVTGADLVEVRLDSVKDPSAAAALAGRRLPVIVTCRPRWEGGQFDGSEEERHRLLREAQQLGAEYVDVEWRANFTDLVNAQGGRGVVLSMHDFNGVPRDLESRAQQMRASGAEVIKLAVMAHRLSDCLPLLAVTRGARHPAVVVAMGEAGLPSRVLARHFGSCWTYAGDGVAPGQIPPARLQHEFAFRSLSERTALYGVVGRPISHSLSPPMHNAAFRALQIDGVYLPLAAADYDDFLTFARAVRLAGVSVTAPFKLDAFRHADDCDPMTRRIKSVNTLRDIHGRWIGCNTDVAGFLAPLEGRVALPGLRVAVLGAGGAARAVAEALTSAGATVAIAARRRERAVEVAELTGGEVTSWPPPASTWDLLVNATPIGTAPHHDESPLPQGPFTGRVVYDLVYNPPQTQLLRDAAGAGCDTIGGLEMLVAQAQRQFEWWTDSRPPARVMRDAAIRALNARVPDGEHQS
jgi:3-dehydroquinate dehydratase / shikimate dehydrogenase